MTHISRPFQIALVAMGLLGVVWFFTLRGNSTSTGGSGSSASSSQAPAQTGKPTSGSAAGANGAAAPTPVYHGAAPGVEGLTRAIAKAHEAVAASQQNARQVEEKSAPQASSSPSTHVVKTHAATPGKSAPTGPGAAKGGSTTGAPPMQQAVEAELKRGKIVAILFWKPKASVDESVQRELRVVAHVLGGKIAVHEARANQAGSFGTITRAVQVYETPTILLVNKQGHTTTLTGLTDVFSLEQAIGEARHA
jgi:cytoskeletal protein RodZ